MESASPQSDDEREESILALVNEYLDRRETGEDLTAEGFAAEHAELAEELRQSLEGLPLIDEARTHVDDTVAAKTPREAPPLPAVAGYELIEKIGRGGMGVVYKALQVSTKRVVALKVMLGGPFASPVARRRFDREVELAARLEHPSIVRVLESGEVAEQRYYAMDYVSGVRLDDYLSAAQCDVRATLKLFARICQAVHYAHDHDVVHRDLKPPNVLIDDQGDPHILDFGLAKATDEAGTEETLITCVSLPGQVLGTLFYLSPEQATGTPSEIDVRTDVYALGVMLFEALTGSFPFDATGRPSEVIRRILEAPPTRPSALSDRVDGELETIILKALEKEKPRRYQSADDLAEDLRRYLEGEPILARRPSGLYVLRKKLRKHRLAVAVVTAVAALSLVAVFAEIWSQQQMLAEARRELAEARRLALRVQDGLEGQIPKNQLGHAQGLLEDHPELPEATLVWAQTLHRTGQEYSGAGFLEDELKRDPSRWACRALLAEFRRAAGDADRADGEQARAERDAPDSAEAWYLRSFATLDKQRALECAEEAVERQPSHVLAWERLTWLRLRTGDLDGALKGADQLIELGESAHHWTLFKGTVLTRQGRFPEAIRVYTQLGFNGYVYLAHTYRRIKEYEKAIECYTKLIERERNTVGAMWHLFQRATPLWILGRREEAVEDYRAFRLLRGRPDYSDARQYIILRDLNRNDEAEQVMEAALDDVKDIWLRRILRCLAGKVPPDKLVAGPEGRDDNLEQLCEAYYYAGEAYLLSGQLAEARQSFERCVETGVQFDPDASPETPMNEYELAQWRLDSRFADDNPTSRP